MTSEKSVYLESRAKRLFDLVGVFLILTPALVFMFLVAMLVLLFDGRPVLIIQARAGKGGYIFSMPKFRTMKGLPSEIPGQITRLGAFLRRHRLDELPQIISVLLGHMSLVGPRPELASIVRMYGSRQKARLGVTPGLTGLWQIKGSREKRIHEQLRYDLFYINKASLCFDLAILIRTVKFVIKPLSWQQ